MTQPPLPPVWSANPLARTPRAVANPPVLSGPLPQAIRTWQEQAAAWIGAADAKAAQQCTVSNPGALPRLVCVGETNRGKSSLINALLGTPSLSPVDAGLATSTYLQFSYGTEEAARTATAHFGNGLADIAFPVTELAAWATTADADVDLPPPRWIEVHLPIPVLRSLVLVDTPGVGGLVAGHAALAAEAAASARALLFVVDASAPLSRGELDFLATVADRVESVHFVVTKIDAFRGHREIVAADQQLLAQYVPRFADAPFHAVSAKLAQLANTQSDPALAKALAEQAGIDRLRAVLAQEVSARAALLAQANQVRATLTVLAGQLVAAERARVGLADGATQADQLRQRRAELIGQRRADGGGRSWQVLLRAETQRARLEFNHGTGREMRDAAQLFRTAIDAASSQRLKEVPYQVDFYLQAVTHRAHTHLQLVMSKVVNTVVTELFTDAERQELAAALSTRPYTPFHTRPAEHVRNADDTIMSLAGGGIGFTAGALLRGTLVSVAPALGLIVMPISIVLGGAMAFFMVRSRRRVSDKQRLKNWLNEVLGEAKAQIDQAVAEQFIEADQQLTLALDDAVSRQVSRLDAQLAAVDAALKLDVATRRAQAAELDSRLQLGRGLHWAGEDLLDKIRTVRPMDGILTPRHLPGAVLPAPFQTAPSSPDPVVPAATETGPVPTDRP